MNRRAEKIASRTAGLQCGGLDPRYLAFFQCFNQQQFFEAHEVLEDLWLEQRDSPDYRFYKGLIQLAGAFVHLQKGRAGPAQSLFKLSAANLSCYPDMHQQFSVLLVTRLIEEWLTATCSAPPGENIFLAKGVPQLSLSLSDGEDRERFSPKSTEIC